ncbi:hypothetical protein PCANC_09224 [Puccinia coronata f. sp. avenae]|uniref:Homeobox domain-containing protein n=1 Tax=Puccinia coronata f. sp. avenae TaxID=200324 RepID=A0A2N5UXI8_9BASI|nr:hypothetical protein PCANC_09224 [Puccinia coronata f. sp. avenae]PLW42463.1 hypothetical protein PCASD_04667 [Puccinia coronata f. sp. avenae]
MLFQLCAYNQVESIAPNPSSTPSSQTSSTKQQLPVPPPPITETAQQPSNYTANNNSSHTSAPPSSTIKSSSSTEPLNNHFPSSVTPSSVTSNHNIFSSAPDTINNDDHHQSPSNITIPTTLAATICHPETQSMSISTLSLPICSGVGPNSSPSSTLDESSTSILFSSQSLTSTASMTSAWSGEFDGFHQQQPFIPVYQQLREQQQHQHNTPSSLSSSPPSRSSTLQQPISPLFQPQPGSQPGHILIDPSSELVLAQNTHHFLPSPPSPSGLISQHPYHHHQLNSLYQHPFSRHNSVSSPIDHPSFNPTAHLHAYPHHHHQQHHQHPLNVKNGPVDLGHPTPCYDPFQIKHRRRTTPAQLNILETQFQLNSKPDVALRKQLSDRLDMTPREVQVWFQNRRAKTKKLEKRAEQESGKGAESEANANSFGLTASPPVSVYLSPPLMGALALPVPPINENSEPLSIGPSPSFLTNTTHAVGESEERLEQGVQNQFDTHTDRRYRSHSLHHQPYYRPPPNMFTGQASNSLTPLAIGNGSLSQQQQQQPHQQQLFNNPTSGDDSSQIARRSSNTSIASSTLTATDSVLIGTPTSTEFLPDDMNVSPGGFDPRRRSSCPAEFVQSFGHFGLANGQLPDITNSQMGLSSFIPTHQNGPDHLVSKLSLDPHSSTPFTLLEDPPVGWDDQAVDSWKTDLSREGIQRRHSLAAMNSPLELHSNGPISNGPIPNEQLNVTPNGLPPLFSWEPTGYPSKLSSSSIESNPSSSIVAGSTINGTKGSTSRLGGYGRRASTSVLKFIEEHPGTMWN